MVIHERCRSKVASKTNYIPFCHVVTHQKFEPMRLGGGGGGGAALFSTQSFPKGSSASVTSFQPFSSSQLKSQRAQSTNMPTLDSFGAE